MVNSIQEIGSRAQNKDLVFCHGQTVAGFNLNKFVRYEGYLINDKSDGQGTLCHFSGDKYVGSWLNG